jgi:hypothetical protein
MYTPQWLALVAMLTAMSTASPPTAPEVEIVGVRPVVLVRVRVIVRNPTRMPVRVPYCRVEDGLKSLCGATTHLEVKNDGQWRAVEYTRPGTVGWAPVEHTFTIEPDHEETCNFEVAKQLFAVADGTAVRLVVEVQTGGTSVEEQRTVSVPTTEFVWPQVPQ